VEKKEYKCLYNHDMCSIASCITPSLDYEGEITREQVERFVYDIKDTDVDAFLCCPTMLRRALWYSEIDDHWKNEAESLEEPTFTHDWKYFEKIYYRFRNYMLKGGDPVRETYEACKQIGVDFFISYRMNDAHVLEQPSTPTIDSFWRDNPQYRIGDFAGSHPLVNNKKAALLQNYLLPEIRDHYYSLLEELVQLYDLDGIELDFMRSPCFFDPSFLTKGTQVMTEFVRSIRHMLNYYGKERGKYIHLCVRVPSTIDNCNKVGLDISQWDKEGLIDMVNISSDFHQTMELDIKGYRSALVNTKIFGEMQFAMASGITTEGFPLNRIVTENIYRTTAHSFLSQGVDGLSFFNFTFVRHHQFNEPRRSAYPGTEPPFEVLKGITSIKNLSNKDRHYFTRSGYGSLPAMNYAKVPLYIRDKNKYFKRATVRVECENTCRGIPVTVSLNGNILKEFESSGELFDPLTIEALPTIEKVRYFRLPLELINDDDDEYLFEISFNHLRKNIKIVGLEVALYK